MPHISLAGSADHRKGLPFSAKLQWFTECPSIRWLTDGWTWFDRTELQIHSSETFCPFQQASQITIHFLQVRATAHCGLCNISCMLCGGETCRYHHQAVWVRGAPPPKMIIILALQWTLPTQSFEIKKNSSYYLVFWTYSRTSDIAFFLFSVFYGPEQNEGGVLSTESSLV